MFIELCCGLILGISVNNIAYIAADPNGLNSMVSTTDAGKLLLTENQWWVRKLPDRPEATKLAW